MTVERDRSIDALRGVLVVALVFVEYLPPAAGEPYRWLRHSPWDGVRVADVVFPGFLFVVGATMAVTDRASIGRAARRAVSLVVIGLLVNAWGDTGTDLSELRIPGVLQTIGVAGLLATLVLNATRRAAWVIGVAVALLVAHAALLDHAFAIDRWLFGDAHLYHDGALGHDPEGAVTMVFGATAVVLLGWVAARLRSPIYALAVLAAALLACLAWAPNKRQWTPSFSLLMVAVGAVALVLLARLTPPMLGAIGRNALLVYVGQHVLRASLEQTPRGEGSLVTAMVDALGDPPRALLLYAALATVVWSGLAILLGRLGFRLRV